MVAPVATSPDLLAGPEGFDDVGAVRQADGQVGLHSVDFFPPVVDDAEAYGAIAAANALSDIYAAGGAPSVVLNLAGFPREWGDDLLQPIFRGAVEVVRESGALWVGGHTVLSEEPLFGFSVYGTVSPQHLITNEAAAAGDRLYLTKPIGAGSLTTGMKKQKVEEAEAQAAITGMRRLNRAASLAMVEAEVRAATDITGFGLLGHAANIARASTVDLHLDAAALPLYPGAQALAEAGVFSGASNRGRENLAQEVLISEQVPDWLGAIGFDAETSGGLLICVPSAQVATFEAASRDCGLVVAVGEVRSGTGKVHLR